jgi:SAM-dependent methyltransferase
MDDIVSAPVFSLTSDVDWASDFCIRELTDFAAEHGVRPTMFATHKSALIDALAASGAIEVGLHPNFLPGSTHGLDIKSVVAHVCELYPQARCFRSHSFMDGSPIMAEFQARGFKYDSNIVTHFDDGLKPIRHAYDLLRFPVFWEDDVQWHRGETWDLDAYYKRFLTPGLKILNVHPIHFALNTPNERFYRALPKSLNKLPPEEIRRLRHDGPGVRTFVTELVARLRAAGFAFHTLGEIFDHSSSPDDSGRSNTLSPEQHRDYWSGDDAARQRNLQQLYEARNATDPYATSRDYNQRELEISAIKRSLRDEPPGHLVDFGCGNGYTLISVAKDIPGWRFDGIDFSQAMIDGANTLKQAGDIRFICGDAIAHIAALAAGSLDGVLTERFLLNLPSKPAQHSFIREVARVLRPGGLFLMCEASMEGFRGLNDLRTSVGLDATPETGTDNVSAIRFADSEIEKFVDEAGFDLRQKYGFSAFFAMSRALHPALISPQKPKFKSKINDLARQLQEQLPFAPGIGSNVLWVLRKR